MSTSGLSALFTPKDISPFSISTVKLSIALLTLCWVAYSLRVLVRYKFLNMFGLDDWLMTLALLVYTVLLGVTNHLAYILHNGRILADFHQFEQLYIVSSFTAAWSTLILKLAVGFFFLRILVDKWSRYLAMGIMILSTLVNFATSIIFLTACGSPSNAAQLVYFQTCNGKPAFTLTQFEASAIYMPMYTNIAVDIIFSLLPIPMLLQTTLDRKQKITVAMFLFLSTIGSVCAVGKAYYAKHNIPASVSESSNVIYIITGYTNYNYAEIASYIIGGCLATYRPLLVRLGRFIGEKVTETRSHFANQSPEQSAGGTRVWRGGDATRKANSNNLQPQRLEPDVTATNQSKSPSSEVSYNIRYAKEATEEVYPKGAYREETV